MNRSKASWKFSDEEKEELVRLWKSGLSTIAIAKKFNCADEPIRQLIIARLPKSEYKKIAKEHMKRFEEKRKLKKIKYPKLNEDLSWWIGVVKGDGNVGTGKNYYVRLGVREKEFRDRWARVGKKIFNFEPKVKTILKEGKKFYLAQFNSKLLVKFLGKNFGKFGSLRWDIPKMIKKSNSKNIFSFLRGLYDAEGSIKYYPRRRGTLVTLVSARKECIEEIQKILFQHGIKSKIVVYKRNDRKNLYYILQILSFPNISQFARNIGFTIERKNLRLSKYMNAKHLGVRN